MQANRDFGSPLQQTNKFILLPSTCILDSLFCVLRYAKHYCVSCKLICSLQHCPIAAITNDWIAESTICLLTSSVSTRSVMILQSKIQYRQRVCVPNTVIVFHFLGFEIDCLS